MPPDHESSICAPAQLPEFVLVNNDLENPHQLVPYIPPIPHQPDDKHAKDVSRRKQNKLNETVMVTKVQNVTPKKKKPWKSGNSRVDARRVSVKRIVKVYYEVALKEIQNLIGSDEHTNIGRWHGVEYDQDFVYIALERCIYSLHELILPQTSSSTQVQSSIDVFKDFKLWKPNGYPSPVPLKVMRDRSIITAKFSDMGISKRLPADMSCLTKSATGYGSSIWQAPEQLRKERQTRAVDLFSFGCVLFFCITGGRHPFGDTLERDVNIVNDRKDLFLIDYIPEAFDLITNLLHPIQEFRLTTAEVYHHPLF
nr:serine/threonine-protein kinase/endoribonuclease IRE1b-like isoform X2 [Tanacetum cinerariifolium]